MARRRPFPGRATPLGGLALLVVVLVGCVLAGCAQSGPTVAAPATSSTVGHHAGRPRPSGTVLSWGAFGSKGKLPGGHRRPFPVAGIPGEVTAIATSNSDSYALTDAGQVWAWGAGAMGELGNGTTPLESTPAVRVDFPAGITIRSLPNPMPFDGALAIDTRGNLWGWGVNTADELCLPGPAVVVRPTKLPVHGVTLATGAARHIVFDAGGTVSACGQGQSGQLGDGTFGRSATPVAVVGLPAVGREGADLVVDGLGRSDEQRRVLRLGLQHVGTAGERDDDEQRGARPRPSARPGVPGLDGRQHRRQRTDLGAAEEWRGLDLGQRHLRADGERHVHELVVTPPGHAAGRCPLGLQVELRRATPPMPSTPRGRSGRGVATTPGSSARAWGPAALGHTAPRHDQP